MREGHPSQSWGRLNYAPAKVALEEDWRFDDIPVNQLKGHGSILATGNARSYGDSAVNQRGAVLLSRRLNRFVSFDTEQGILHCEAGLLLADILKVIVPRGWYLPVVPGTQLITLGGAIANDIHGKNHVGEGTIGRHITEITLLRSDGQRLRCSAESHADLFRATIAGLGLTGLIVAAKIRLRPVTGSSVLSEVIPFGSLQEYVQLAQESSGWPYTVAWVDCSRSKNAGRGVFTRGRFSHEPEPNNAKPGPGLSIPVELPVGMVNRGSVTLFNKMYYARESRKRRQVLRHEQFFFPLDTISHWNRIYGPLGFYQYQFVVPYQDAVEVINQVIRQIADSGSGSFLTVLKDFGPLTSPGILSFPFEGLTLAVDMPNRGAATLDLLTKLDTLVQAGNGRIYPAKDARMPGELFRRQYPQWTELETFRDPKFSSSFWRRVTQ